MPFFRGGYSKTRFAITHESCPNSKQGHSGRDCGISAENTAVKSCNPAEYFSESAIATVRFLRAWR